MASRKSKQPRLISGIIANVIRSFGLTSDYNGWLVVSRWAEIVGANVAKHAHAKRYDDGVLVVAVPDDSWRQTLAMEIEPILDKIWSYPYGRAVKKIRLERG